MISQEELRELLKYNPETGDFTWLVPIKYTSVKPGDVAGFHDGGYLRQGIHGKYYRLHRLAFLWMHGVMPEEVDHINHDKLDNRWENLRAVSHEDNGRNQSQHSTNTSGTTGVYKTKEKYIARIYVDGEHKNLGTYDNIEDAKDARRYAEYYYKFHENHGE